MTIVVTDQIEDMNIRVSDDNLDSNKWGLISRKYL